MALDYFLSIGLCVLGGAIIVLGSIFFNFGTSNNSEQTSLIIGGLSVIILAFFFPLRSRKRFILSTLVIILMGVYLGFQSSDVPPALACVLGVISILYIIRNKVIKT